jgi:hypothetical protein
VKEVTFSKVVYSNMLCTSCHEEEDRAEARALGEGSIQGIKYGGFKWI